MGLFDNLKDQALKGMNGLASNLQEKLNEYQNPQTNKEAPPPAPRQTQQAPTSKQVYDQHLENLIEMALADGELTEKEKQVLFKKAEAQGIDLDEFEMVLDAKLYEKQKSTNSMQSAHQSAPKSEKYGDVRKCPNCGAILESFITKCPDCDFEFTNVEAVSSISKLFKKLESLDEQKGGGFFSIFKDEGIEEKKISIVKTFPIPNTKEDLLEFLSVAAPLGKKKSIFSAGEDSMTQSMRSAWREKCGQVIMKARFSMKDDKATLAEIERYAKELKI